MAASAGAAQKTTTAGQARAPTFFMSLFNMITGFMTSGENQTAAPISEQVTCTFKGSDSTQTCFGNEFKCSGSGTCVAEVSGNNGTAITWKSTCGGYAYTVIDGNNENAVLSCEQAQVQPPVETTPTTPTPMATPAPTSEQSTEIIKDRVRCIFLNSKSEQTCGTSAGGFACTGIESCQVEVSGEKGKQQLWKSTCGGYTYTTIDSYGEDVRFECAPTATQIGRAHV